MVKKIIINEFNEAINDSIIEIAPNTNLNLLEEWTNKEFDFFENCEEDFINRLLKLLGDMKDTFEWSLCNDYKKRICNKNLLIIFLNRCLLFEVLDIKKLM